MSQFKAKRPLVASLLSSQHHHTEQDRKLDDVWEVYTMAGYSFEDGLAILATGLTGHQQTVQTLVEAVFEEGTMVFIRRVSVKVKCIDAVALARDLGLLE